MKMRLLIFWALSQHGLASEDGIIFQISMYNWIAFSDTWHNNCQSGKAKI